MQPSRKPNILPKPGGLLRECSRVRRGEKSVCSDGLSLPPSLGKAGAPDRRGLHRRLCVGRTWREGTWGPG